MNLQNLVFRTQRLLFLSAFSLAALSAAEFVFYATDLDFKHLSMLSHSIAILGVSLIFMVHYLFFLNRRKVMKALLQALKLRSKSYKHENLLKIFQSDFPKFLKSLYIILPRQLNFEKNSDLEAFIYNYERYQNLNQLDEKVGQALKDFADFNFSFRLSLFDSFLFLAPFFILESDVVSLQAKVFLLGAIRLFTIGFVCSLYKEKGDLKSLTNKLQTFLSSAPEEGEVLETRFSLDFAEEKKVFLLIDRLRKNEFKELARSAISFNESYSDWALVSGENYLEISKEDVKKAIFLYPSELGFSIETIRDFIEQFDEYLVIDVSPESATLDSHIYYIDHDQRTKKVNPEMNLERLSGDKGLILRNLDSDVILKSLEEKMRSSKTLYLNYNKENAPSFCSIETEKTNKDFYCEISSDKKAESLSLAKSFVANCSYAHLLKQKKIELKAKVS